MTTSDGVDKAARVWSVTERKLLTTLHEDGDDVGTASAAFSLDGSLVVTVSHEKKVKIWNTKDGKLLRTLHARARASAVCSARFSPDGSLLVTVDDRSATIWSVSDGTEVREFRRRVREFQWYGAADGEKGSELEFAVFSPDGSAVVTVSVSKYLTVWAVTGDGSVCRCGRRCGFGCAPRYMNQSDFGGDGRRRYLAFSADGSSVVIFPALGFQGRGFSSAGVQVYNWSWCSISRTMWLEMQTDERTRTEGVNSILRTQPGSGGKYGVLSLHWV